MGQDDSCGICGKHYQTCSHRAKEHIAAEGGLGISLCGSGGLYVDFGSDMDPDNVCKKCQKSLIKMAREDFGRFLYVMQANS